MADGRWHPPSTMAIDSLFCEFVSCEEVADFETRGVLGIGTMGGVVLDVGAPFLPDGPLRGIGRVGRAHQLAPVENGIVLLQRHHDDRTTGHEVHQRLEEWLAGMY